MNHSFIVNFHSNILGSFFEFSLGIKEYPRQRIERRQWEALHHARGNLSIHEFAWDITIEITNKWISNNSIDFVGNVSKNSRRRTCARVSRWMRTNKSIDEKVIRDDAAWVGNTFTGALATDTCWEIFARGAHCGDRGIGSTTCWTQMRALRTNDSLKRSHRSQLLPSSIRLSSFAIKIIICKLAAELVEL